MKKIFIAIIVCLMLSTLALYLVDVFVLEKSPTEDLLEFVLLLIGLLLTLFKICTRMKSAESLSFYERTYAENIKNAFSRDPKSRKTLLQALRLYNEGRYKAAAKKLISLQPKCCTNDDYEAVGIFLGRTYTEMRFLDDAIRVYQYVINRGVESATVHGNLGLIYSQMGDTDTAIEHMQMALRYNPEHAASLNNLASIYFEFSDFETAKKYAHQALEINRKFYQASNLLAIIYSLEGNDEEASKYIHLSAAAGVSPEETKRAIEYYKRSFAEKEEEET